MVANACGSVLSGAVPLKTRKTADAIVCRKATARGWNSLLCKAVKHSQIDTIEYCAMYQFHPVSHYPRLNAFERNPNDALSVPSHLTVEYVAKCSLTVPAVR